MWVIRHVDEIAATCVVHDLAAVHAAALFHDAIYDPRSPTNEADSAALAVRVLVAIGWPPDRCLAVRRSIEATAHHTPVGAVHTLDTDVLLDADLAILASAPAVYTAYAAGVRSEYSHVSDAEWRTGRASFLHRVLVADAIFRTPMMRIDHEPRARSNLAAELSSLQPGQ